MEKYPFAYKETHPHLEAVFYTFLQEHHDQLSHRIVASFLSNPEYYRLFVDAVCFPAPHYHRQLDEAFRRHFSEIRLIHYLTKLITHAARDFYQKERKRRLHLSLYAVYNRHSDQEKEVIELVVCSTKRLQDHISHPSLYKALSHLPKRQLTILELHFLYRLTHKEIGQVLGISQQSVSKSYSKALTSLRVFYREGEYIGSGRMD
ncbi:sigma-70 family RNA polymerase sigma factor [Aneurinibacillus sp. REN35]|uniref:sigma-70 family RNA polymerase sigma factor n=2 Tax=Paenibacillaceae TaxID=186822 RepID=UPI0035275DEC